jgi:preprotein translocase subunit SecA
LLNAVDSRWKDHLHAVDALKTGIGLRGYGQLDPKNEYKREGFELFQSLLAAIEDEVTSLLLRIRVNVEPPPQQAAGEAPEAAAQASAGPQPRPSPSVANAPTQLQRPSPAAASPNGANAPAQPPAQRRPAAASGNSVPATHAFDLKRRQDAIKRAQEIERAKTSSGGDGANGQAAQPQQPAKAVPKVDRNAPCPCGSGKKYKKCHGSAE